MRGGLADDPGSRILDRFLWEVEEERVAVVDAK